MTDPLFTSTTFAGSGAQSLTLPANDDGNVMVLVVTQAASSDISTPSGWTESSSPGGTNPNGQWFYRHRVSGDTSVSFTTAAAGAAVCIGFPVPFTGDPENLTIEALAQTTDPAGIDYTPDSNPRPLVAVSWPADATDPVGEFTLQEYANSAGREIAAYYAPTGASATNWPRRDAFVDLWVWSWGAGNPWTVGRVAWGSRSTGWH